MLLLMIIYFNKKEIFSRYDYFNLLQLMFIEVIYYKISYMRKIIIVIQNKFNFEEFLVYYFNFKCFKVKSLNDLNVYGIVGD